MQNKWLGTYRLFVKFKNGKFSIKTFRRIKMQLKKVVEKNDEHARSNYVNRRLIIITSVSLIVKFFLY